MFTLNFVRAGIFLITKFDKFCKLTSPTLMRGNVYAGFLSIRMKA